MLTPAGKECPFYYADFHRGRAVEECRQVAANPASAPWRPRDCARCPIPDILRANASPNLRLKLTIMCRSCWASCGRCRSGVVRSTTSLWRTRIPAARSAEENPPSSCSRTLG